MNVLLTIGDFNAHLIEQYIYIYIYIYVLYTGIHYIHACILYRVLIVLIVDPIYRINYNYGYILPHIYIYPHLLQLTHGLILIQVISIYIDRYSEYLVI